MPTESELLHTWRSAPNRPNVLVLAPSEASYLPHVTEMRETDGCEVVHVKTGEAAIRLLRRGAIAVLLLDGQATEPGGVELMVEALNKEGPPRIVVFSSQGSARGAYESRQVRRARIPMDKDTLQKVVRACAKEFSGRPSPVGMAEILDSIQELADPGWLRVTDGTGKTGDLCFQGTRAVYAETGDVVGPEAAMRIAQWVDCRFEWRELPAYLQGNMDLPLAELLTGPRKDQTGTVPAAEAAPPSFLMPGVITETPDPVEEPAEFAFETTMFAAGDTDGILSDLPGEMDWAQDLGEPVGDFAVEEPTDFSLDFEAFEPLNAPPEPPPAEPPPSKPAWNEAFESDEPLPLPPLYADPPDIPEPPATAPVSQQERPELARISSNLFQATAILTESGVVETCVPAPEAAGFDLVWLRSIYRQISEHLCAKGMGEVTELPILGAVGGLVLSPLPDGRLLAVRLRSGSYGWEERDELERLRQAALAMAAPAFQ